MISSCRKPLLSSIRQIPGLAVGPKKRKRVRRGADPDSGDDQAINDILAQREARRMGENEQAQREQEAEEANPSIKVCSPYSFRSSHSHCRYIMIQDPLSLSMLQAREAPPHRQDLQRSATSLNLTTLRTLTLRTMMSALAIKHAHEKYMFTYFVKLFSPAF